MSKKIRVGAVSYLNTKPLVYGFEKGMMSDQISLNFDYPSKLATQLINDEIDIGLIPVAVIAKLNEYYFVSDYCIGTEGEVASVCLFSDVPLNDIEIIYLDYQSRTLVILLQILLKEFWKISPQIIVSEKNYEANIIGAKAGLVIGDRAFNQRKKSKYHYDLGLAWKGLTGLPFVFAVWVSNKDIPQYFKDDFNKATANGLNRINEIVSSINFIEYDLYKYYTTNISYDLNHPKKEALKLFLKLAAEYNH